MSALGTLIKKKASGAERLGSVIASLSPKVVESTRAVSDTLRSSSFSF